MIVFELVDNIEVVWNNRLVKIGAGDILRIVSWQDNKVGFYHYCIIEKWLFNKCHRNYIGDVDLDRLYKVTKPKSRSAKELYLVWKLKYG